MTEVSHGSVDGNADIEGKKISKVEEGENWKIKRRKTSGRNEAESKKNENYVLKCFRSYILMIA